MLKKLFDWTPRDVAYWEALRKKGLRRFVLWYGVAISGGVLFVFLSVIAFFFWLKAFPGGPGGLPVTTRLIYLLLELVFVMALSLAGGVINSLVTWLVEEKIYRSRYEQR